MHLQMQVRMQESMESSPSPESESTTSTKMSPHALRVEIGHLKNLLANGTPPRPFASMYAFELSMVALQSKLNSHARLRKVCQQRRQGSRVSC